MKPTNRPASRPVVEAGLPADDGRAFRRCLGQYPTGVAVITAQLGDQRVGMAVNSFAAVSLDPALVLWSIRRESGSAPVFLEASHFAINVLAAEQVEVSQLFGSSHPERFERCAWNAGLQALPLLDGALAHLECRRHAVYEGGDHLILVGQVERYARFEGEPLLFTQGQYAVTKNHPSLPTPATALPEPLAQSSDASFLQLLSHTNLHLSAQFEQHRQAHGVTVASGRLLSRLYEGPRSLEALERATYLSRDAVEDGLRELAAQGFVAQQQDQSFALTPEGRARREALAARAAAFTAEKLAGIDAADIEAARRVMRALQG